MTERILRTSWSPRSLSSVFVQDIEQRLTRQIKVQHLLSQNQNQAEKHISRQQRFHAVSTMKSLALLLVAVLAPMSVMSIEHHPAWVCKKQHNYFYKAINKFCNNDNIVVPSNYASAGKKDEGRWIGVTGNCKPQPYLLLTLSAMDR